MMSYQAVQAPSASLAAGWSWRAAGIEPASALMPQVPRHVPRSLMSVAQTFWTCCAPPAELAGPTHDTLCMRT